MEGWHTHSAAIDTHRDFIYMLKITQTLLLCIADVFFLYTMHATLLPIRINSSLQINIDDVCVYIRTWSIPKNAYIVSE